MSKMETKFEGKHGPGIYGFFGEFRWLSNFCLAVTEFEGQVFPSVENAYQSAKTSDINDRLPMTEKTSDDEMKEGMRARKFGRQVNLRPDWEEIKVNVMSHVVEQKFRRNATLRTALLETGDLHLEETNYWGDKFWGVCKDEGQNHLGKILMNVRSRLRSESSC